MRILEGCGAILAMIGMIYLQYRRAKWIIDRKDQKVTSRLCSPVRSKEGFSQC